MIVETCFQRFALVPVLKLSMPLLLGECMYMYICRPDFHKNANSSLDDDVIKFLNNYSMKTFTIISHSRDVVPNL